MLDRMAHDRVENTCATSGYALDVLNEPLAVTRHATGRDPAFAG